jgi:hypothetical protein
VSLGKQTNYTDRKTSALLDGPSVVAKQRAEQLYFAQACALLTMTNALSNNWQKAFRQKAVLNGPTVSAV